MQHDIHGTGESGCLHSVRHLRVYAGDARVMPSAALL
jgi:hypothetical protein